MKIIHFSDIHVGGWIRNPRGFFDKRILGSFNYIFRRHRHIKWKYFDKCLEIIKIQKPDVVCFTGDLVSIGDVFEFKNVIKKMTPLVEDTSFELLCVPGNHDRYIKNKATLKMLNFTYNYLNRQKFALDSFPIKKTIKNLDFYLIDESYATSWTKSNGYAKQKDIDIIKEWTKNKKNSTVLVGHYPLKDNKGNDLPSHRNLRNSTKLYELLKQKSIDVALCGHTHYPFIRQEKSMALEICAGSLTISGKINKLNYDKNTKKFKQEWIIL